MKENYIKETLAFKELSEEEKKARGILGRLYGPCADFINPTRNGRTYSDELWEKVFNENELVKEALANGGIPGELDHPADREEIDSSKIAIIMPEAPKKGKDGKLIAYFDILDTPNGRIAYALAKYGYKLGISSRGTGDVDEYTDSVVPESYDFKCFDLVLTPSVKDARLTMTEALDTKALEFKQALTESLETSNPDEKKIMEETLDKLNIKLENAKLNENSTPDVEEVEEETKVEKSHEDKIKELFSLIYKGDTAPTEEETEAFIQAFESVFPEECFSSESCTDKEESETSEETVNETEEANDDGSEELIKSLQDALTKQSELEREVKSLQEQVAVSDTEATRYEEEMANYKEAISRLSEEAHSAVELKVKVNSLEEELKIKDSKIHELVESKEKESSNNKSLTESISSKDVEIVKLNENLNKQKEDYESQIKQLNEQLEKDKSVLNEKSSLVEKWQKFAQSATDRYLESKANMFGLRLKDVKSRLPKEYDLNDIDTICESLQDYSINVNKLPFDLDNKRIKKVQLVESKNDKLKLPSYVDDTVDDSLLDLAGLK